MTTVTAKEFALTHATDEGWIALDPERTIEAWGLGDRVNYGGIHSNIVRHYFNGMWEIKVPGGLVCVSGSELKPR